MDAPAAPRKRAAGALLLPFLLGLPVAWTDGAFLWLALPAFAFWVAVPGQVGQAGAWLPWAQLIGLGLGVTVGAVVPVRSIESISTYPGVRILLCELEAYGESFDLWPGVDPGLALRLPSRVVTLNMARRIVVTQTPYGAGAPWVCGTGAPTLVGTAPIPPEAPALAPVPWRWICLRERLLAECCAFVLNRDTQTLRMLLRDSGESRLVDVDLAVHYPEFTVRDLTPVPGSADEFALWGADPQGRLRVLRFAVGADLEQSLPEMLLSDRVHADRLAPRSCVAVEQAPDRAWLIEDQSNALLCYSFSTGRVETVLTGSRRLQDINFLRLAHPRLPNRSEFSLWGADQEGSFDYMVFHHPVASTRVELHFHEGADGPTRVIPWPKAPFGGSHWPAVR